MHLVNHILREKDQVYDTIDLKYAHIYKVQV